MQGKNFIQGFGGALVLTIFLFAFSSVFQPLNYLTQLSLANFFMVFGTLAVASVFVNVVAMAIKPLRVAPMAVFISMLLGGFGVLVLSNSVIAEFSVIMLVVFSVLSAGLGLAMTTALKL